MSYNPDFSQRSDHADLTESLFYERWSPRAFKKVALSQSAKEAIFDAARFAPSSFNLQPWRFVTNRDNEESFQTFLNFLIEKNQVSAVNASLLGVVVANIVSIDENKPNHSAVFDTGLAFMSMMLQAKLLGLFVHAYGGIKRDFIYETLNIDQQKFQICCGFAIGGLASPDILPAELADREKPSARVPLNDIWHQGDFLAQ